MTNKLLKVTFEQKKKVLRKKFFEIENIEHPVPKNGTFFGTFHKMIQISKSKIVKHPKLNFFENSDFRLHFDVHYISVRFFAKEQ